MKERCRECRRRADCNWYAFNARPPVDSGAQRPPGLQALVLATTVHAQPIQLETESCSRSTCSPAGQTVWQLPPASTAPLSAAGGPASTFQLCCLVSAPPWSQHQAQTAQAPPQRASWRLRPMCSPGSARILLVVALLHCAAARQPAATNGGAGAAASAKAVAAAKRQLLQCPQQCPDAGAFEPAGVLGLGMEWHGMHLQTAFTRCSAPHTLREGTAAATCSALPLEQQTSIRNTLISRCSNVVLAGGSTGGC